MMDINGADCGDHFSIFTNIESLFCTPKTSVMYANYISIKKMYTEGNYPRVLSIKYNFSYLAFCLEIYLNFSEPNTKTAYKAMIGYSSFQLDLNSQK